jgi:hypothetical protein
VNEILQSIEQHKDLADVAIKTLGLLGTAAGALVVIWKYFHEKKAARLEEEFSLRRQAYLDLFAIIPKQLAVLGASLNDRPEAPAFVLEDGFRVLHRLHLLAGSEALKCIIERNSIYHEGMIELIKLKQKALQLDGPGVKQAERLSAWDAFVTRHQKVIIGLSENYRTLVTLVRRDIGLDSGLDEITAAFEREQRSALQLIEGLYSNFRTHLMSVA